MDLRSDGEPMTPRRSPAGDGVDVLKGVAAGFIGGLAGTWVMSHTQGWWSRAVDGAEPQSAAGRHDARDWQERSEGQNANELAAQRVASYAIGRRLDEQELEVSAAAMHYSFGAVSGALYGGLVEAAPQAAAIRGAAYGIALWAVADEIAMPLLELSRSTTRRPLEMHMQALVAHLAYGLATDVVRRGLRRLI